MEESEELVLQKLYQLKAHAAALSPDDKNFVEAMVALYQRGGNLTRDQLLRIHDIDVPGGNTS